MKRKATRIDYSRRFDKHLKKAPLGIKIAFRNRLSIFIQDPFHPQLNNHSLTGRLTGFRSINITGDWQAIYCEARDERSEAHSEESSFGSGLVVIFEILGTHSQLYK